MGIVQYTGAQNPHSETVNISGYVNFILNATPGEVLTLPDAVCSYLVGNEPNWWVPSGGWTPPPAGPQTGYVATVFSTYTILVTNGVVIADPTSGGSFPVTLPDATASPGQRISINHPGSANTVTVTPAGGQTIAGLASLLLTAGQSVQVYSDGGTKWRVLSENALSAPNTFSAQQTFKGGLAVAAVLGGQNGQNVSGVANIVYNSQDNPIVNAAQLGVDALQSALKEQHVTSARATDNGAGAPLTLNPGGAIGTDQAGAILRLASGDSTGAGVGGAIAWSITPAGSSGTTVNGFVDRLYLALIGGFSALYPAAVSNGFLGIASNPWYFAYITTLNVGGGAGFWGHAVPGSQPAAPVTLSDVIAIIRGCGLSA